MNVKVTDETLPKRNKQLSSISQLKLAWANYQWDAKGKYVSGREYTKNQEEFCMRVAETNDLALLRWVREEKECAWDWRTGGMAAMLGNLEMLKYCYENGCEVHAGTCAIARRGIWSVVIYSVCVCVCVCVATCRVPTTLTKDYY
jgi:hypothetical protein